MSPLETLMTATALTGFLLSCIAFVALVWKVSWAVRGWVALQNAHAENTRQVTEILREFVTTQQEANRYLQTNMQSLASRLNDLDVAQEDLHRGVRAVNRKLLYLEGEDAERTQKHTA